MFGQSRGQQGSEQLGTRGASELSALPPGRAPHPCPLPAAEIAVSFLDPANIGVASNVLSSPTFWFAILAVYTINFGMRYAERTFEWTFRPHDTMILAEKERKVCRGGSSSASAWRNRAAR